jgi:hypothetical protein
MVFLITLRFPCIELSKPEISFKAKTCAIFNPTPTTPPLSPLCPKKILKNRAISGIFGHPSRQISLALSPLPRLFGKNGEFCGMRSFSHPTSTAVFKLSPPGNGNETLHGNLQAGVLLPPVKSASSICRSSVAIAEPRCLKNRLLLLGNPFSYTPTIRSKS